MHCWVIKLWTLFVSEWPYLIYIHGESWNHQRYISQQIYDANLKLMGVVYKMSLKGNNERHDGGSKWHYRRSVYKYNKKGMSQARSISEIIQLQNRKLKGKELRMSSSSEEKTMQGHQLYTTRTTTVITKGHQLYKTTTTTTRKEGHNLYASQIE